MLGRRGLLRFGPVSRKGHLLRRGVATFAATLIVATLGGLTYARNNLYRNKGSMWLDVTNKRPTNARAHSNLGNDYTSLERNEEAIESYKTAIRLQADHAIAQLNLACTLSKLGRHEQAIDHYKLAIKHQKKLHNQREAAKAYCNFADAWAHLKQLDKAVHYYGRAIKLRGDYASAQYNLGNVLYRLNRYDEAVHYYEMAVENRKTLKTTANLVSLYNNLAHVYVRQNQLDKAAIYYRRTIEVKPDHHKALNNLAWMLATSPDDGTRNGPEAVELAERACEATDHSHPGYMDTLAAAYAETGQFEKAITTIQRAVKLASAKANLRAVERFHSRAKLYRQHKPLRVSR